MESPLGKESIPCWSGVSSGNVRPCVETDTLSIFVQTAPTSGLNRGINMESSMENASNEYQRPEFRDLDADLNVFEINNLNSELPSFAMNEAERVQKSFQERRADVDSAIEWIKNEIKNLKGQDQNLMKQFVKLRSSLNSLKSRPALGRKVSLPEGAMSPGGADPHWVEYPMGEFLSEGQRRRTQSAFAGKLQEYIFDWCED